MAASDTSSTDRGREARTPKEVPGSGWTDVAVRVKNEISRDNVSLVAAGLALYALLAAFPALAAALSIYGMVASPEQVASQVQALAGVLPQQAADILTNQLQNLARKQGGALGFGAIVGILLSLWSARKGMTALMTATNIAYDEQEERGFFKQILVSLAFTVGAVIGFVVVALVAVAVPLFLESLGMAGGLQILLSALRWVLLWFLIVLGLAVVYRYAPDRDEPRWRWVTWGSAIAATLWIVGSVVFSLYVRNFGSYGETYGSLGGVVVLLLWFYLSGFIVVLGAEINAELEHQTRRDTTEGRQRRMGNRDAYVADTVGERRR
jgi:membrane protein